MLKIKPQAPKSLVKKVQKVFFFLIEWGTYILLLEHFGFVFSSFFYNLHLKNVKMKDKIIIKNTLMTSVGAFEKNGKY